MIRLKPTRTLGLAFYDQAILLAELRGKAGKQPSLSRAAQFALDPQQSLDQPEALGTALGQFLKQQGFSARDCVIGLPAQWVMSKFQQIPPIADHHAHALTGVVRLKAEVAFASDARELAVDYLPPTDPASNQQQVLLLAALRKRIDQVMAVAQAAGLTPQAITSTSAVLAMADCQHSSDDALVLLLSSQGAELSLQRSGQVQMIRPISQAPTASDPGAGQTLLREIRRLAAAHAREFQGARLRLWDSVGINDQLAEQLGCALAMQPLQRGKLEDLAHPNGVLQQAGPIDLFSPAVALARSAMQPQLRPVDFLHSRLDTPAVGRWPRQWRLAAVAAVLLAILAGGTWFHYGTLETQVTALEQQYRQAGPQLRVAQSIVDQVQHAQGWFDQRPGVLDIIRDLTLQYPEHGQIWVTDLTLREDMEVFVTGRAQDDRSVLSLLDRLQASETFNEVKVQYLRQADRSQREVAYAIVFRYRKGADQ